MSRRVASPTPASRPHLGQIQGAQLQGQGGDRAVCQVLEGVAAPAQQLGRRIVGLGMDAGVVQNQVALGHPQESRALLKGFRTQLGYLAQLLAGGEGTVFLPVQDDISGGGGVQSRHPGQQGGGGGVHVHPHAR